MFFHPPRGREARRTPASRPQRQGCTHGPAGRGDELPVPRGEVGQVRPRRSRGAAAGERAGPSGAAPPPQRRGENCPRPPHPQHGRLRGSAGRRPRAARGVVRPAPPVPAVHGGGRASPPARPRVLHGCGGSRRRFRGRPAPRHFPGTGGKRGPGSSRAAGPPRSRPSAPGVPRRWAARPARWRGGRQRSALRRSTRLCVPRNPLLLCCLSSCFW